MTFVLSVEPNLQGDTTYASIKSGDTYTFQNMSYDEAGIHEVIINSAAGCDSLVYLNLTIDEDLGVYLPNVFSPNSVSGNDRFLIVSDDNIIIRAYNIYDRWGNLVFERKDLGSQMVTTIFGMAI